VRPLLVERAHEFSSLAHLGPRALVFPRRQPGVPRCSPRERSRPAGPMGSKELRALSTKMLSSPSGPLLASSDKFKLFLGELPIANTNTITVVSLNSPATADRIGGCGLCVQHGRWPWIACQVRSCSVHRPSLAAGWHASRRGKGSVICPAAFSKEASGPRPYLGPWPAISSSSEP